MNFPGGRRKSPVPAKLLTSMSYNMRYIFCSGPEQRGRGGRCLSNFGKKTFDLWRCIDRNELKIVIAPPTLQTFQLPESFKKKLRTCPTERLQHVYMYTSGIHYNFCEGETVHRARRAFKRLISLPIWARAMFQLFQSRLRCC